MKCFVGIATVKQLVQEESAHQTNRLLKISENARMKITGTAQLASKLIVNLVKTISKWLH